MSDFNGLDPHELDEGDFLRKMFADGTFFIPSGAVTSDQLLAAFFHMSPRTFREHSIHRADGDRLPAVQMGHRYAITADAFAAWVDTNATAATPKATTKTARRKRCPSRNGSASSD